MLACQTTVRFEMWRNGDVQLRSITYPAASGDSRVGEAGPSPRSPPAALAIAHRGSRGAVSERVAQPTAPAAAVIGPVTLTTGGRTTASKMW